MSENRMPNRAIMTCLPREPGTFKTHKDDNGDALATPTKGGRLDSSPLHLFDEHVKTWSRIDESKPNSSAKANIIEKLQPSPASPRFVNDVTKAPSSDQDNKKNALDQRPASVASSRKSYLAAPETY